MNKNNLYIVAAVIWGVPGAILTLKGLKAYLAMPGASLWWLLLITAAVLTGFFFMFGRIVDKYSARIAALPTHTNFFQTFPLRGWILVVFMMCLGMVLKFIPGIPAEFTASFYSGLGPMLLWSAVRFILKRQSL
ncbi:MAG: hypothetical protein K6E35_08540 [Bacteroidales bacterium]|nr:hypothetical protein [Bacteroidales bacterium]